MIEAMPGCAPATQPARGDATAGWRLALRRRKETATGKRAIYITDHDHERLEALVAAAGASKNGVGAALEDLRKELGRAKIVEAEKIPADVVTMNSRVRLTDVDTGEKMEYTLVFPNLADIDAARLSVLSPVGTAILGYAAGDVIEWRVPKGKRRIRIDEVVYQPEAQGHYPL